MLKEYYYYYYYGRYLSVLQYGCNFVPRRYFFFISIVSEFPFVSICARMSQVGASEWKSTQTPPPRHKKSPEHCSENIKGSRAKKKCIPTTEVQFVCVIPSSGNIYVSAISCNSAWHIAIMYYVRTPLQPPALIDTSRTHRINLNKFLSRFHSARKMLHTQCSFYSTTEIQKLQTKQNWRKNPNDKGKQNGNLL